MTWPSRRRMPRNILALGSLTFTLLLVTACGLPARAILQGRAAVNATATPANTFNLAWRAAAIPPKGNLAIAPGDGDIAYICQVENARRITISVTRDRAVHWTHAGDIALAMDANQCFITVDSLQPTTAVVATIWEPKGASPIIAFFTNYVTFDGGATWRTLSPPKPYSVSQFATLNGVIYGYLLVAEGEQDIPELAISRDQMRTWRPILDKVSAFDDISGVFFWLNPSTGALLARSDSAFWSSSDAGAHWTQVTVPGISTPGEGIVIQAPLANQPWRLCAVGNDELNPKDLQPNTLSCSFDGGQTWRQEPGLNLVFSSAKGTFAMPTDVLALASDGAVLATSISSGDAGTISLYRLASGAQTWQMLAPPPGKESMTNYYPAPGGGVLWEWMNKGLFTASYP